MTADRRRLVAGALFSALLLVLCLRFAWLSSDLAAGEVSGGYFAECEGRIGLVREPDRWDDFPPSESVGPDGRFSIAPGNVRVLQLGEGVSYSLWLKDAQRAPYVVVAEEAGERAATCLLQARTPDLSAGAFQLVDWNGAVPWSEDAARLSAVARQCGGGGPETPLKIESREGRVTLALGRCTSSYVSSPRAGAVSTWPLSPPRMDCMAGARRHGGSIVRSAGLASRVSCWSLLFSLCC